MPATNTATAFEQPGEACQMHGLLEVLSGPWTMHILCSLAINGPMRFGELKRHIGGVSARVLTVRLRMLEGRGFIHRHATDEVPSEVTYSPAKRLEEMTVVIKALRALAVNWEGENVDDAESGVTSNLPL
jgi:DNA-binding HxlR family transcriptional regulator